MSGAMLRPGRAFCATLLALTATGQAARPATAESPSFEGVMEEQVAADERSAASQRRVAEIDDDMRQMTRRSRQLAEEAEKLGEYSDQLAGQVQSQRGEMEFVQRQLLEMDATAREVLPLMQKMVSAFGAFVALDVPFLPEERQARVADLRETLNRADVSISEKYRRILEAYQIEMDYGRTIETWRGRLGASEQARTVQFLRVGRVSLLYQTLDGTESGYWDAEQKSFVVDNSYQREVRDGFAVALRLGAPDLLVVPVPAPRKGRS